MTRLTVVGGTEAPQRRLRAFDVDCLGCREITMGDFDFEPRPPIGDDENYTRPMLARGFRCEHCGCSIGAVGPFMMEVDVLEDA